jgi:hypothetical protein
LKGKYKEFLGKNLINATMLPGIVRRVGYEEYYFQPQ